MLKGFRIFIYAAALFAAGCAEAEEGTIVSAEQAGFKVATVAESCTTRGLSPFAGR